MIIYNMLFYLIKSISMQISSIELKKVEMHIIFRFPCKLFLVLAISLSTVNQCLFFVRNKQGLRDLIREASHCSWRAQCLINPTWSTLESDAFIPCNWIPTCSYIFFMHFVPFSLIRWIRQVSEIQMFYNN